MSDRRLRMGVVGVGHVGRHHARILAGRDDVSLVAVADVDAGRARDVAGETGARPETDAHELLGDVDAVTVAVPTAAHEAVAVPFLEAGVPVLVEKPMAATLAEADSMVDASRRSGAILGVGHSERYNPAIATALPLVRNPRFVEIHRLAAFPARSLDVDVVFDVMIHDLDVVLAFVDGTPVVIEAVGVPVLSDRVDIANARIRFDSGCIVNLTASRISRDRVRKLRFFQTDALVTVDCAAQEVEAWRVVRHAHREPEIIGGRIEVPPGEPLAHELDDFVQSVRKGREPTVSGVAGRRALELADRVAQSIVRGLPGGQPQTSL